MIANYFNQIPTNLCFNSSHAILRMEADDIINRLTENFELNEELSSILFHLKQVPDSPKFRHWVTVSRSLLRSMYKKIDFEPRFIAHIYIDSLESNRLIEIHCMRALEIVIEHYGVSTQAFKWGSLDIVMPRFFNIWGIGTFEFGENQKNIQINIDHDSYNIIINNQSVCSGSFSEGEPKVSNSVRFERDVRLHSDFGHVVIPIATPGIADCFHSNSPVIRSHSVVVEWSTVLLDAIYLLATLDKNLATDCIRLSPAILPLHRSGSSYGSSSPEEICGLIFLPGVNDVYDITECLLHECLHQKLFRAEMGSSLFADESGDPEIYYSPWRSDPRPLRMLIHGAYVFSGIASMWQQIGEKFDVDSDNWVNAKFHSYYRTRQSDIALKIAKKYGNYTVFGNKVVQIIESNNETHLNNLYPEEAQNEADIRIKEHLKAYEKYKA